MAAAWLHFSVYQAEQELNQLGFHVDSLNQRLEEADGFCSAQNELNRRREQELMKLKKDFDLLATERALSETSLRKRHQEALNELAQQLENGSRQRAKCEKEKQQVLTELESLTGLIEVTTKAKAVAEMKAGELDEQLRRTKALSNEQSYHLQDANALNARLGQENSDLHRHLQELNNANAVLAKAKASSREELEDLQIKLDEETRARNQLAIQVTNLQLDLDKASRRIEEEMEAAENANAQMHRALTDLQQANVKYDKEMAVLAEQFDDTRHKMAARIAELEHEGEQVRTRSSKFEKERNQLQVQINDLYVELEATRIQAGESSKRLKQAELANNELQNRIEELINDEEISANEIRRLNTDFVRLRVAHDEVIVKLDAANRESKQMAETCDDAQSENKDLRNHMQDLNFVRSQLESDRDGLSAEINELHDNLRDAQLRWEAANATMNQLKADTEQRLRDKDEETNVICKSNRRAIEELQKTVDDVESKYKAELSHVRKKFDQLAADYELQLETMNRSNSELSRANKTLGGRIKDMELMLDEERRCGEDSRQVVTILERKRIALQAELEDMRSLVETADRARKNTQSEIDETHQHVADISLALTTAASDRRRLEAELTAVRSELDDVIRDRQGSADRAGRLQLELNRAGDELRHAEDALRAGEALRNRMEGELRELSARLEVSETGTQRESKKLVSKLQSKLMESEVELENAVRQERDLANENRKLHRILADQKAQFDEERRQAVQAAEQNQALQQRVKTMKRQLAEAEEVVLLTLNKYRKADQLLKEVERAHSCSPILEVAKGGSHSGMNVSRSMSVTREITRVVRV